MGSMVRLVNSCGHWAGKGRWGRLQRLLSWVVVLNTVVLLAAEVYSTRSYFMEGDVKTGLINLNELLSGIQCSVTLFTFIYYQRDMTLLIQLLEGLTERVLEEENNAQAVAEIKRRRKRCLWAYRTFFVSFLIICHWAIRPLVHFLLYGDRGVIVHSWLPFDNNDVAGFFGNFFFQLLPAQSYCICFCMFGSVFVSFSELTLGHLNVLKYRLENLKYGEKDTTEGLVRCIKYHTDVLRIIHIFQKFTAVPLIGLCLLTVLVLCVVLFELTLVEDTTNERIINLLEEAEQEFLILATYCWYANETTAQSMELQNKAYLANWYQGTQADKKCLLQLMTRARKSGHFGGFIRIDLLTFINVLKGAFSYYNFLEAVN